MAERLGSALRVPQGWPLDVNGGALVADATEESIDHEAVAQEVVPLVVRQVGRDDCGLAAVAFLHEPEEDVGLLGSDVQIAQLVDDQDVESGESCDEPGRGPVREGGVHLVEEVLCADELAAVAVLQGLEEQAGGEAGLAHAGLADEDDVLGPGNEVELGEGADLAAVDAGLFGVGEALKGPLLGQT